MIKDGDSWLTQFYWSVRSYCFNQLSDLYTHWVDYRNPCFARGDRFLNYHLPQSQVTPLLSSSLPPYGETPLSTMRKLCQRLELPAGTRIAELGSGRGRLALWLATHYACEVVGIEREIFLINCARAAASYGGVKPTQLRFELGEVESVELEGFDLVYFYGLGYSDRSYHALCRHLLSLKTPPRIITIGVCLLDYSPNFYLMDRMPVIFPWGWTEAFIQIPIHI